MINCHNDFMKFNMAISLTANEKRKLETSRDAIANKIDRHFREKGYQSPKFIGQGSFSMNTSIRPLEGYYDLDLGVYLTGLKGDPEDWPRTETIHQLIYRAIEGHTSIKPISKSSCVRVIYRSPYVNNEDISYHIDLPVYAFKKSFWSEEVKTVIGFKGDKQWSEYSNPKDFINWFQGKCNQNRKDSEQLKRVVKYLKAWKDNLPKSPKMPSGMILTVLAAKNYKQDLRDDIAFINTVKEFEYRLKWLFQIIKPVEPENDLSESLSDREEENFMQRVDSLIAISEDAIGAQKYEQSIGKWSRIFGPRFTNNNKNKLIG